MGKLENYQIINKLKRGFLDILEVINEFKTQNIKNFDKKDTIILVVDMVKGFAEKGNLYSERIKNIILPICDLVKKSNFLNISVIAFADCHEDISPEFNSYPIHCLKDNEESEIVEEIKKCCNYKLINKNSTNGFFEKEFKEFIDNNSNINNFIIVGNCTDICISQLALSLKAYFNNKNIMKNIIVPMNLVETYDAPPHDAELINIMSIYNMHINGIEILKELV